ncbi:MAG: ABC transporter ATP-binding protein [Lactobacillaceae bacterium]|nr:ABC transporter ATP-binding protein [Lactobacillaceae bacterium]
MLKIINLNKKYGDRYVLKNINVSFNNTGITIIVGANGSGKTTFFNCLVGMSSIEDNGSIFLDNYFVGDRKFKELVFYVPSDFFLPEFMTGFEYSNFVLSRYPRSNKEDFLKLIQILNIEDYKKTLLSEYSFGMKKKIQIAVAIATHTKYILADEIFSGLDFETTIIVQEIFKYISKKQHIIIVSHESNVVNKFSDKILLMKNGNLTPFKGSVDDISSLIRRENDVWNKITEIQRYFDN